MAKIILDLCGGTGAWSAPYRESAEYAVYVVTKPAYDIRDVKYEGDFIVFHHGTKFNLSLRITEIYGVLAAPPCTQFSMARNRWGERDFKMALVAVDACLSIIREIRLTPGNTLKFWALENPVGYLRRFLGKPPLTFSPEEYGDNYTKRTDIWGDFIIPKRMRVTEDYKSRWIYSGQHRPLPDIPEGYVIPDDMSKKAVQRAITSRAFAEAFYKANR